MAIVLSVAEVDPLQQIGGARWVVERHTDSAGAVHTIGPYLAPTGFDIDARMASHAVELQEQLAAVELERVLNGA